MSEQSEADQKTPEQIKGPGGLNMRELHELVKQGHARDQAGQAANALKQPQNRWQRLVRYVWDKKRGKRG
jgi:hypothetical protein